MAKKTSKTFIGQLMELAVIAAKRYQQKPQVTLVIHEANLDIMLQPGYMDTVGGKPVVQSCRHPIRTMPDERQYNKKRAPMRLQR